MKTGKTLSVFIVLLMWLGCEETPRRESGPAVGSVGVERPAVPPPTKAAPVQDVAPSTAKADPPKEDPPAPAAAPSAEPVQTAAAVQDAQPADEMPAPADDLAEDDVDLDDGIPVEEDDPPEDETPPPKPVPAQTAKPAESKKTASAPPADAAKAKSADAKPAAAPKGKKPEPAKAATPEKKEQAKPAEPAKPEEKAKPDETAPAVADEKEEPKTAEPAGPEPILWDDFEFSNQWAVESAEGPASLGLSTGQKSHGEKALRAAFAATNRKRFHIRREVRMDLTLMDSILVDVYREPKEPMEFRLTLHTGPGAKMYESPPVKLESGWNRDITFDLRAETFKVDGSGGCDGLFDGRDDVRRIGFLFDEKDNTRGAVYIDNIRFTGNPAEHWRQYRPRITQVVPSTETVKLYEMIEFAVTFEASYESYYDPADIKVTGVFSGPDYRKVTVRGFFDGCEKGEDGKDVPVWRIRFAPTVTGRWDYQVTVKNKMGEDVCETQRIECAEKGESRGYVRRSYRDDEYFEFYNGAFYYPIGQNVAWSGDYEDYFQKMHESGENYVRIWMCPWNMELERAPYVGEYDLDVARAIDTVLDLAEKYDLYVQLVFDYHGMLRDDNWSKNPYNVDNGGPCASPMDFFVDKEAKKLYKRRLEYIAARWGASTRVFAWELFNEVDLTKYYDEDDVVRWHNEMTAHLRRSDPYGHLITSSSYGTDLSKRLASVSNILIVQKHIYSPRIVKTIRERWQEYHRYRKPYFVSEFGAGTQPETDVDDIRGVTVHAGLWSAFMTPSAGNAMPWWWDVAVDPNDLYGHWAALAAFAEGEDRRGKDHKLVHATIPLTGGKKLEVQGLLCKTELLLWIYDPAKIESAGSPDYTHIPAGTYLWLVGMAEGEYDIEFWDTYKGCRIEDLSKRSDRGRLKIVFPEAERDMACKVKFRGRLAEPALRLKVDETEDDVPRTDARTPR